MLKEKSVADNPFASGKTEDSIFWKIYQEAMDPILLVGFDNCVLDCNTALLHQLGLKDKSQLIGRSIGDFSPPYQPDGSLSSEKISGLTAELLKKGRIRFETAHIRVDGSLFEVETTAMIVTWKGQQLIYSQLHDISGQKQLLRKLHDSEETARRIFEDAADPVVLFCQGLIIDCNKAALRQLGYQSKRELLDKTPMDVAPPVQADGRPTQVVIGELVSEATRSGSKSFEWIVKRKDGSVFDAEFTLTLMAMQGEEMLHIRWREIGEQKRLTRELRESEESFRRIFEEAAAPILLFKDGRMVDGNLAVAQLLGYPDKQILAGKTPMDLAPPRQPNGQSSAEMVRDLTLAALRQGHHYFAWQMQRIDGSLIDTEITLTSIKIRGELLLHAQLRDLTEQNRLQAALYAEKERAEITLASIGDAVITTDAKGHVTFLNHVASKLTGWDASEAIGRPTAEVFHIVNESTRERVHSPIDEVLQNGKTVNLANHTVLIAHDGREYNIEDSAAPIYLHDRSLLGCVLVFHDVTEKHQLLKNVRWQAGHDVLTGLPNRVLLADRFERALSAARRQKNLLGVCLMDLDQFKPVNDLYGHNIGDQLLIEVTNRMNVTVRNEDTIARLGGDEFVILLGNLVDIPQLELVLHRILGAVSAPYSIESHTINISASIGVAIYPMDNADADTLMRHADQAMYLAKQAGRNRFHWFDVAHDQRTQTTQQTLASIRNALHDNQLCLHYQPKVDMRSGSIVGMEALLRWQHPQQGLIPPMDFLPAAEQTDLIIDIGEWVIEEALIQSKLWLEAGKDWPISVNIAARHFHLPDFLDRLKAILACHPAVPARQIEIEILESVALGDINHVRNLIVDCQALGVKFSLDDFGTGYSSLSYLKRLPADTLKIDQSFVRDMLDDQEDLALIEAVIGLANAFNRKVVAEGVETIEHGVLLMRLGCHIGQGYGIARPMSAEHVLAWAAQFRPDPKWARWSSLPWDMRDLPLLVAQNDHTQWVNRVLQATGNTPLPMPQEQLENYHQCRFGLWYEGEGRARYGHLAEFNRIETPHAEIHRIGTEIIRLHTIGNSKAARQLSPTLLHLKEQILTNLDNLQLAIHEQIFTRIP